MSQGVQASDLQGASPETLKMILEEGDKRVAAQAEVMLAADARSNGILAASTALAAAGFAVAADQVGEASAVLFIAAATFACVTTLSALAAVWALWPEFLNVPGWSPRLFVEDIARGKTDQQIAAEMAALAQSKIDENEICNRKLAKRSKAAMLLLAAGPLCGACAGAFAAGLPFAVVGAFIFPVLVGLLLFGLKACR